MYTLGRYILITGFILVFGLVMLMNEEEFKNAALHPAENDREIMDDYMAQHMSEDAVLTAKMYLKQAVNDLTALEEENLKNLHLQEHKHIDGIIAFEADDKKVIEQYGNLETDITGYLEHVPSVNNWRYSEPYIIQGSEKMAAGKKTGDKWIAAQLDLSHLREFLEETVRRAGENSGFDLNSDSEDISFSKLEADDRSAHGKVAEFNWGFYVTREHAETDVTEEIRNGEVIVKLNPEIKPSMWASQHGVELVDSFSDTAVVRSADKSVYQMMSFWKADPDIVYMEPNYNYEKQSRTTDYAATLPNDEFYFDFQWNLKKLNFEEVWGAETGSPAVITAVLDSGADGDHPDLRDRIAEGYNAFEENGLYQDDNGHGTHVAGIIGASTNNVHGIAGATWETPILAVKVLDSEAVGSAYTIAKGIRWAVDNGATVLNLSLGDEHHSEVMHEAVKYAYEQGAVIVAAAGNEGTSVPMYPAAYDEVLAVGSINEFDRLSMFSNYGDHIDVTAPGEHIPSTYKDGEYVVMSGTSMAAPHVSAAAALFLSLNPDETNEVFYDAVRSTAEDQGPEGKDPFYGYGLLDPAALLASH